ncbi:hypothetical protein HZS_4757 [Henneguya salminicola]|nr:hypothetical protein HZS_4757 [Henneguya salminicola]
MPFRQVSLNNLTANRFHKLFVLREYNWMPSVITVDFENSLISASRILGCYFILNEAIFQKLKKITQSSSLIKLIID